MRIGVDLDEVLADYLTAVLKCYNSTHGTSWKRDDFFSYDFWEVWGGTREAMIEEIYAFYQTDYFKKMQVIAGASAGINELKKDNELFIVTSRQDDIVEVTRQWVEQEFPETFTEIYFVNGYSRTGPSRTKAEICDSLKLDLLLEDQFKYALECISDNRKVILFNYPWNRRFKETAGIFRVADWPEALKLINNL